MKKLIKAILITGVCVSSVFSTLIFSPALADLFTLYNSSYKFPFVNLTLPGFSYFFVNPKKSQISQSETIQVFTMVFLLLT
jgi:hypothetical protein